MTKRVISSFIWSCLEIDINFSVIVWDGKVLFSFKNFSICNELSLKPSLHIIKMSSFWISKTVSYASTSSTIPIGKAYESISLILLSLNRYDEGAQVLVILATYLTSSIFNISKVEKHSFLCLIFRIELIVLIVLHKNLVLST